MKSLEFAQFVKKVNKKKVDVSYSDISECLQIGHVFLDREWLELYSKQRDTLTLTHISR